MSAAEITILQELLAANSEFVSGTRLAERLQISRVAVWSYMEKLRARGFEFEARPRLGYRIRQFPETIEPLFLQTLMPERWQKSPLFFFEEIDSTNSEAERQLAAGTRGPFIILARSQSRGRGRLGRPWHSENSGNLYLTLVFQPGLPPARMQAFTLWMGTAICHFLNLDLQIPVQIKWPNDLILDEKKLGGMLTEARIDNDRIRDLSFGLGINVNSSETALPPDLRGIATSLAASTGTLFDLNRFAAKLLTTILDAYQKFISEDTRPELQSLWSRYDFLAGKPVATLQGNLRIQGEAVGIDADGSLILQQTDGLQKHVSAGDVTLEKPPFR